MIELLLNEIYFKNVQKKRIELDYRRLVAYYLDPFTGAEIISFF